MTARTVGQIRPEHAAVDWFDADTPGLALRVYPSGARSWFSFYKRGRTTRRCKLGTWPTVGLKHAREAALDTRYMVEREGGDPAHDRRKDRDAYTVKDLSDLYVKHWATRKRTGKDDQYRINRYLLPPWGSRPVGDITRQDVHALLDKIVAAGHPTQANRVLALISKLFNFGVDRGHLPVSPAYRMGKPAPEYARTTVLSDDDLRTLWDSLDADLGDASDSIRLRLLTGARGGEVHGMKWTSVDLAMKLWIIPGSMAKNGREHRVPLSDAALAIMERRKEQRKCDDPRVFPGLYHQREDLRELGSIHGGRYRWHDLRRTVATRLAGLGFAEEVIGRVLNHAKRGITSTVYNQHRYDDEKRAALDAWARALSAIVASATRDNVVSIATRRS